MKKETTLQQIIICDTIKAYNAGKGNPKIFNSPKAAEVFLLECIAGTEGSEQSRYVDAYMDVLNGETVVPLYRLR